jgi:hypothetical protein
MGFATFRASPRAPRKRGSRLDAVPGGATPFGAFPSTSAVPRHRGPYPLAVPPRSRGFPSRVATGSVTARSRPPTSGSCSAAESVARVPALPPSRGPMLPWASFPRVGSTSSPPRSPNGARVRPADPPLPWGRGTLPLGRGDSANRWGVAFALVHGPLCRASAAALPPPRLVRSS